MIRYHGTPITPTHVLITALRGKHAMVSFQQPQQIEEAAEVCQSIVLDNGAFSAWRKGAKHDFAGYQQWAAHWLRHPAVEWCVIPDVIDGDEKANDDLLGAWDIGDCGQRSVPVFHMHESLDRLDRLVHSYPRVALGSSGSFSEPGSPAWWARMAEMMAVACDDDGMPVTKLHGLRMLDPVIFSHVPLTSADSCNVARNIGIDSRWDNAPYAPRSKASRAMTMIDINEHHPSSRRWCSQSSGVQQNMELLG